MDTNFSKIKSKRKGVTPVIAIVLLLTVTIGAVGILYTQVGDLLDQGSDTQDISRVQDTEIELGTAYGYINETEAVSTSSPYDQDTLYITIQNTGKRAIAVNEEFNLLINGVDYQVYDRVGDIPINTDQTEGIDPNTGKYSAGCMSENMKLDIGENTQDIGGADGLGGASHFNGERPIAGCNTGIKFPSAFDESVTITLKLEGSSKSYSLICDRETNQRNIC